MIESINTDDYNLAISRIMIGAEPNPEKNHQCEDDIFVLISKIREKLEDTPAAIFPFIDSCTRKADNLADIQ